MRLRNKAALITGGTSGIGRATAELFAAEGASVAFTGRRVGLGQAVERKIRASGGAALFLASDDSSFMTGAAVPVDGGNTAA